MALAQRLSTVWWALSADPLALVPPACSALLAVAATLTCLGHPSAASTQPRDGPGRRGAGEHAGLMRRPAKAEVFSAPVRFPLLWGRDPVSVFLTFLPILPPKRRFSEGREGLCSSCEMRGAALTLSAC